MDSRNSKSFEKQTNQKVHEKSDYLVAIEDFSLLEGLQNDFQKKVPEENNTIGVTNADTEGGEIEVIEEPGFRELGKVNLNDIEDPVNLTEPDSNILLAVVNPLEKEKNQSKKKNSEDSFFSDPDLNPPDDPLILIRHPGVKKIYNQGMTALIQKNHLHAIMVFENFTKRFPNNIDTDNAFYWIGRSYFALNKLDKSELAFRKVLTLFEHRPTSQGYKTPDSIYMLGKIQFRKKFSKAFLLDKDFTSCSINNLWA